MKLTPEQRDTILKDYIAWSDRLFEDLDWVEPIPPSEFVRKIIDLVEEVNEQP
jgi:hypothetical protein